MKFLHLATALIASATYINASPQPKKKNDPYRSGNEKPVEGEHAEPKNLLPNAGFEENERGAPYEIFREGVKISSDPALARTGNRSALFELKSRQDRPTLRLDHLTELKASTPYMLRGYFRVVQGDSITEDDYCQIFGLLHNAGATHHIMIGASVEHNDYREFSLPLYNFPGGERFELMVGCERGLGKGSSVAISIDDISLKEGTGSWVKGAKHKTYLPPVDVHWGGGLFENPKTKWLGPPQDTPERGSSGF
ncbi:hypothetical protein HG530_014986 [Fusarium avenaceum]|nr:hypothetical protein HG530_014986 [Fusarium avenaceum]